MVSPATHEGSDVLPARCAGILLHPTSLPGNHGIGDLGPAATDFLDWIAEAAIRVWQVLPLGPTGPSDSPFDSPSAFAGNPSLISPCLLASRGWLTDDEVGSAPGLPGDRVYFSLVAPWKRQLFKAAWARFRREATREARLEFDAFVEDPFQTEWLEDWALFAALKESHGGRAWLEWDEDYRLRRPAAMREAARKLADSVACHRFLQFVFARQWESLKNAARARGILLFGDAPFCVALDSADVWAHRELFELDDGGRPLKVAGVPPDYFSATGQLWGNPIYRWDHHAETGYEWWIRRIAMNLRRVDVLRLDHFRGFAAFWEIDANASDATEGRWVPGPGRALFDAVQNALGRLPLVAEDLGLITDDVCALKASLGLPGMHVLQFAFDDVNSSHLPERHSRNAVAYTGTHDNDTLRGWVESLDTLKRQRVLHQLDSDEGGIEWRLIEAAYASPARMAIVPLQDLLGLGTEARMNVPGVADGNWSWRAPRSPMTLELAARLRALAESTGRAG